MVSGNEEEEVRKIQFSGRSSYTLALPKRWVEEMDLHAGDRVSVVRRDQRTLLITAGNTAAPKGSEEIVLKASSRDVSGSLIRKLVSLYLQGYNVIRIIGKEERLNPRDREATKLLVRRKLVGTEIIEDSSEAVSLQVLLNQAQMTIDSALRRMYLIASSMHRDAVRSLLELEKASAAEIPKTDDEVDRFGLYIVRQLNFALESDAALRMTGMKERKDCLGYRLIVKSLERIADHAAMMAEEVIGLGAPLSDEAKSKVRDFSNFALQSLEKAMNSLFKRDYRLADEAVAEVGKVREMERSIINLLGTKRKRAEASNLRLILEDVTRTAEYAADIAEVVMNMMVEELLSSSQLPGKT